MLVSVDNANGILIPYFIYMLCSNDSNDLVNVTSPIHIGMSLRSATALVHPT